TCGEIQLPLNNVGVMALDFLSNKGIASSIGHAPGAALISPSAGSKLAIAEALTNIVFTPLTHGLKGVSLSANWMWPAKQAGENARLYEAVEAVSKFAIDLGINIPTGKDSLSMTQKYPNGDVVLSPGTVIISAVAEVNDIRKTITPTIESIDGSTLVYINFSKDEFKLGGSSFAQVLNLLGDEAPSVTDAAYFSSAFEATQKLLKENLILAGHDVSAGGLITTLLEMCFPKTQAGLEFDISKLGTDTVKVLFSENPAVVLQVNDHRAFEILDNNGIQYFRIAKITSSGILSLTTINQRQSFSIEQFRKIWYKTSYLLDKKQRTKGHADKRFENFSKQPLQYNFPPKFDGQFETFGIDPKRRKSTGLKAAIIREKGVNGDREMAYSLYLAGFDVKDVHMTDLVSGREDLTEMKMIVFVGGFSNSDVLGSAKGWAGAFLYNQKAKIALENFYKRKDTLSLGVCNGCQLMMELGLLYPDMEQRHPRMHHNGSGKFESSFINLSIPENNSIMLKSLAGSRLGVWVAHGEGRFLLPENKSSFSVAATYSYSEYPGNPNDSDNGVAALCSTDGRHLAIMPHLERSLFPWNWPYYQTDRKSDAISPWIEAFVNAREYLKNH
ncbi:MAG: phosphoribosylformylglycinamidine synthase subunit PurQ, partial [Cyclobacteriaceae bacterium]|nr:phosphoribosylformylglycinamidine synthase subunit PurQ [Cyclobacteriaceae bacterium]